MEKIRNPRDAIQNFCYGLKKLSDHFKLKGRITKSTNWCTNSLAEALLTVWKGRIELKEEFA